MHLAALLAQPLLMTLTLMACPSLMTHLGNTCGRMLQVMLRLVIQVHKIVRVQMLQELSRHPLWGTIIIVNLGMQILLKFSGTPMTPSGTVTVVPPVTPAATLQTCRGLAE